MMAEGAQRVVQRWLPGEAPRWPDHVVYRPSTRLRFCSQRIEAAANAAEWRAEVDRAFDVMKRVRAVPDAGLNDAFDVLAAVIRAGPPAGAKRKRLLHRHADAVALFWPSYVIRFETDDSSALIEIRPAGTIAEGARLLLAKGECTTVENARRRAREAATIIGFTPPDGRTLRRP
jgi:hypothetical protein